MKKVNYSETIAARDLKLIDLMNVYEYSRSNSFFDLVQCHRLRFNLLYSETTGPFSTKF